MTNVKYNHILHAEKRAKSPLKLKPSRSFCNVWIPYAPL